MPAAPLGPVDALAPLDSLDALHFLDTLDFLDALGPIDPVDFLGAIDPIGTVGAVLTIHRLGTIEPRHASSRDRRRPAPRTSFHHPRASSFVAAVPAPALARVIGLHNHRSARGLAPWALTLVRIG